MLHGVSLTLVTFSRVHHNLEGQAFTIFILTVAAREAGLALSLILALYQKAKTLDIDFWTDLREAEMPSPRQAAQASARTMVEAPVMEFPRLTPAGAIPDLGGDMEAKLVDRVPRPTGEDPTQKPTPAELIENNLRQPTIRT
jgi:NADH-quinone oxidoreductase subunit K